MASIRVERWQNMPEKQPLEIVEGDLSIEIDQDGTIFIDGPTPNEYVELTLDQVKQVCAFLQDRVIPTMEKKNK